MWGVFEVEVGSLKLLFLGKGGIFGVFLGLVLQFLQGKFEVIGFGN